MISCPECKTEYEKEAKYCFKCRIAFTDDLPENISKYLRKTPSSSNIHTATNTGTIGKPPLTRNPSITGTGITNKPPLINSVGSSSSSNINSFNSNSSNNNHNIISSNITSVTSPINSLNSNSSINSNVSPPISNSNSTSSGNLINSGGGTRPRLQSSPVHPTNPLPPIPPNNRMSVPVSTSPTARTPPPPPTSSSPTQQYTSSVSTTPTTTSHINKPPTPPIGTNRNVSPINTPSPNIINNSNINNNNINNNNNNSAVSPVNVDYSATTNYSSPQFTNDYNNTAPMSKRPLSRRIPPPPPNKKTAIAKWDCIPDQEGDLAFNAGDVITIISKDDDGSGWWLGSANGKTGMFPANYLCSDE